MLSQARRLLHRATPVVSVAGRSLATRAGTPAVAAHVLDCISSTDDVRRLRKVLKEDGNGAQAKSASGSWPSAVVIKVGGEVVMKGMEQLVDSVRFLRAMGKLPILVHGGGPQLNDELAALGVEPEYRGGHRVTDERVLGIAERVFTEANRDLASGLEAAGIKATAFAGNVLVAEEADGGALGFVGRITGLDTAAVEAALEQGAVPVLNSLGRGEGGQLYNINADVAARELAVALRPSKVVFVSAGGGWKEPSGLVARELDLGEHFEALEGRDYEGRQGTLLKLREAKALVDGLEEGGSMTICAAEALPAQLLSRRGPGTQIFKGHPIDRFDTVGSCDLQLLRGVVERNGGWPAALDLDTLLLSNPGTTGAPTTVIDAVYATHDYGAAAVVARRQTTAGTEPGDNGSTGAIPVLVGVWADEGKQSSGAVDDLWARLKSDYPRLAWASAPSRAHPLDPSPPPAGAGPELLRHASAQPHADLMVAMGPNSVQCAPGELSNRLAAAEQPCVMGWGVPSTEAQAAVEAVLGPQRVAPTPETGDIATDVVRPVAYRAAPFRLGLVGARGFTGRELVRLIAHHGDMELVAAGSRAMAGQDVLAALGVSPADIPDNGIPKGLQFTAQMTPEDIVAGTVPLHGEGQPDAWVLALPNGLCDEYATAIRAAHGVDASSVESMQRDGPVILDLSADQRFDDSGVWAYGLPERTGARAVIASRRCIANPGCYATGAQSAIMPLVGDAGVLGSAGGLADAGAVPHVFGVSGYSGAGSTRGDKNDPDRLRDNLLPYALANHIHEREISRHLGLKCAFMPHVAPYFQGISITASVQLDPAQVSGMSNAEVEEMVHARFAAFYEGEPLVSVLPRGEVPDVASQGTRRHGVVVGGMTASVGTDGPPRVAVVATLDNLLKGAATQAMQNLNIALGAEQELQGIDAFLP